MTVMMAPVGHRTLRVESHVPSYYSTSTIITNMHAIQLNPKDASMSELMNTIIKNK